MSCKPHTIYCLQYYPPYEYEYHLRVCEFSLFLFLILNLLLIKDLKCLLRYSSFTTLSALKRGPLLKDRILLAVVLPEAKDPVIPTLIILVSNVIALLIRHLFLG